MKYILLITLALFITTPAQGQTCRALNQTDTLSCKGKRVVVPRSEYRIFNCKVVKFDGTRPIAVGKQCQVFDTQSEIAICKQGLFDDKVVHGYDRRAENGPPPFDCDRFWKELTDLNDLVPYYWLRTVQP